MLTPVKLKRKKRMGVGNLSVSVAIAEQIKQ